MLKIQSDNLIVPQNGADTKQLAAIIQDMLQGTLSRTEPPDTSKLSDESRAIFQTLWEAYTDQDMDGLDHIIDAMKTADPKLADMLSSTHIGGLHFYTAAEYMNRPPIQYLDEHKLIPSKGLILAYGKPGDGKSLWILHTVVELSAKMSVILVLAEGQDGMSDRLRAEMKLHGEEALSNNLYILPQPVNLRKADDIGLFIEAIQDQKLKPKLLVFDTLSGCTPGMDENTSEGVGPVIEQAKRIIRDLKAAVILVHHSRKNDDEFRGHTMLHSDPDVQILIKKNAKNEVTITTRKVKDGPNDTKLVYKIEVLETRHNSETGEPVKSVALSPIDHSVSEDDYTDEDDTEEEVLKNQTEVLEALKGGALGRQQLIDATGIPKTTLGRLLKTISTQGYIEQKEKRGPFSITQQGKNFLGQ
jgi:hypothetical protein